MLFERKCVLAVCVHIYPIMAKIHPVIFILIPKNNIPFFKWVHSQLLVCVTSHGRLTLDPPWVSWQQQCCQFEDFVAKFSYFLIVAANFMDFFATRSYFCYIEIKIVIYFGEFLLLLCHTLGPWPLTFALNHVNRHRMVSVWHESTARAIRKHDIIHWPFCAVLLKVERA